MQGKRAATDDTALRFGHWFGKSAQFWLNLQNCYDISLILPDLGRVCESILHAVPDMTCNFYSVSDRPRHERNLIRWGGER